MANLWTANRRLWLVGALRALLTTFEPRIPGTSATRPHRGLAGRVARRGAAQRYGRMIVWKSYGSRWKPRRS